MDIISIDRQSTNFSNQFIQDYFSDKFNELRTYAPRLEEVARAIEAKRDFSSQKRETLNQVLLTQYRENEILLEPESLVSKNIWLLLKDNTFTVTTGQQIHIGLGPMYVIYKTLETIAICKELRELHPRHNFVPVFWMASEDHDLEEIQTVSVFGKSFTWNTEQKGAVGRMVTEGIPELFEEMMLALNLDNDQKEFIALCKDSYTDSTLSRAFRKVLHHYFGKEGLVIVDGDNRELKKSFVPVLLDEINAKNADALSASTSHLASLGVERQIITRDINLFTLRNSQRLKIQKKDNGWADELGNFLFSSEDLEAQILEQVADLSPNAAIRPLYQEWILPNLIYVGGAAEVKYWLQLKGLFDNYAIPVPLVHLRTSGIILSKKKIEKVQIATLDDFFLPEHQLIIKYGDELSVLREAFFSRLEIIKAELDMLSDDFEKAFAGASVRKKVGKILPKIIELEEITNSQLIAKNTISSNLDRILKIKAMYFSTTIIQERTEHSLAYCGVIKELVSATAQLFGISNQQKISVILI